MLRIRLKRVGRKNEPHYQVVVIPRTNAAKGHITAKLGWYDPKTKHSYINKEAALKWLNNGAQPTNSAAKVLVTQKIDHKLINVVQATPKSPKKKSKGKKKAPTTAPKTLELSEVKSDEVKKENEEETKEEIKQEQAPEVTDEEVGEQEKSNKRMEMSIEDRNQKKEK